MYDDSMEKDKEFFPLTILLLVLQYSKARDVAQVYEVKVKTIAPKLGSKTVTEYANQLKDLWQELDHYRVITTKCPEDVVVLKDFIKQDRVYDFLVELNPEFDQV